MCSKRLRGSRASEQRTNMPYQVREALRDILPHFFCLPGAAGAGLFFTFLAETHREKRQRIAAASSQQAPSN
jgi:hypothetical protein